MNDVIIKIKLLNLFFQIKYKLNFSTAFEVFRFKFVSNLLLILCSISSGELQNYEQQRNITNTFTDWIQNQVTILLNTGNKILLYCIRYLWIHYQVNFVCKIRYKHKWRFEKLWSNNYWFIENSHNKYSWSHIVQKIQKVWTIKFRSVTVI